eukprot:TRINITY_DN38968_c0_g1_i1.p1 TRINITY_DN38968_c0_g1~~TRINITY_DN38968_c0_g1_i1.p1  ORF type:complete len:108 (-),score=27.42 TRINITY_DN38968_c0_g1_i1:125-448(-)
MEEFEERIQQLEKQREEIAQRRQFAEKQLQMRSDFNKNLLDIQIKNLEEEGKRIKVFRERIGAKYRQYREILERYDNLEEAKPNIEASLEKLIDAKKHFIFAIIPIQ